ncbi:MAG: DUF418 domain-containing protein [Vicinamibacterales bacterium]
MTNRPPARPIADAERCTSLDVIRGLALIGVLLVNIHSDFQIPLAADLLGVRTSDLWVDHAVDLAIVGLLQFKAFTLFSLLFGAGLAVFGQRAAAQGVNPTRLLTRRLLVLLALGLCHLLLIWNGDILTLYAVCGLLLVPLRRLPALGLAAVGVAALALPYAVPWGVGLPAEDILRGIATEAARIYTVGRVEDVIVFHWHETRTLILPLLVDVLPRTYGLMALGAAAWNAGVFTSPERHGRLLIGIALVGIAVGGGATILSTLQIPTSLPSRLLGAASSAPLAMGYAAGLVLILRLPAAPRTAALFAAVGRMALTNYLAQSVALGVLFYGYGLGLYGRVGSAAAAAIGLSLYAAQLAFSWAWLKRYRFGPVEWIWRSVTYGRGQPMLRRVRP